MVDSSKEPVLGRQPVEFGFADLPEACLAVLRLVAEPSVVLAFAASLERVEHFGLVRLALPFRCRLPVLAVRHR